MTTQNCIDATPPFSLANGGTNNGSLTASAGGVVWSDASKLNVLAGTATASQMLQSGSSATPAWSTATWPATTTLNQLLYSSSSNEVAGLATTDSAALITSSLGVPQWAALTNGQIIIGSTSGAPSAGTITAGTNITVTNGSNSITIAATGVGGFSYVNQNTSSVTMAINTGYITNNGATLVTYTLPTTAAQGSIFEVVGGSSGGWTIIYSTGQSIGYGDVSTTTTSGSLSSSNAGDCVRFVCTTANTGFRVISSVGNLTYV
jgi:hypothetical protein